VARYDETQNRGICWPTMGSCATGSRFARRCKTLRPFWRLQKEFGSFDRIRVAVRQADSRASKSLAAITDQLPARTEQSDAMSKDLKKRGFKFVGSTICYAFMQATGMVNDHLVSCYRYTALL
jgi:DNA-3-methyladenine glycosylase I